MLDLDDFFNQDCILGCTNYLQVTEIKYSFNQELDL